MSRKKESRKKERLKREQRNGSGRSWRKRNGRPMKAGFGAARKSPTPSLAEQKNGEPIYKIKGPEFYPWKPRAPFAMCFTQDALNAMLDTVGRQHPETGAKGFAPFDHFGFDVIEFDVEGSRSATFGTYEPDVTWGEERRDFHLDAEDQREWSGDIHSHPNNNGHPSEAESPGSSKGDLGYVRAVFAANDTMQYFLLPIITHGPYAGRDKKMLGKSVAWIHPWIIERGREEEPMIAEVKICEVSKFSERICNPEWEAAVQAFEEADENEDGQLSFEEFTAWYIDGQGTGAQVAAVEAAKKTEEEVVRTVRPRTLTDWALKEEFRKRLGDAVSPNFHQNGIMVVGVGAGSYMVEKLARMSPASISLCDPDVVEISNLARASYEFEDVGSAKVDAMEKRLHRINPSLALKTCTKRIQELSNSELDDMFEGVGVVIAGTDNFDAQAFLNEECVRRGVPAMFIGIHDGGEGGRIRWVVEGGPCYRCIDAVRFEDVEGDSEALDLDGANGSILDCQIIDMIAAKICVGLLERGQKSAYGAFYDGIRDVSEAVVINSEDYEWGQDLMDQMFASEEPNVQEALNESRVYFRAPTTLWFTNERDEGCPVCGTNADSSAEGFHSSSSKGQIEEVSI